MEEREFFCRDDRPLIGWRLFRVRDSSSGPVLTAPLVHNPDFEVFPTRTMRATCCEHAHPAPFPGCRCGLYVAVEGTLDSLSGYLRDSAHDADLPVLAEVACTGRAFLDARGVRAEKITVLTLVPWAYEAPATAPPDARLEQVATAYAVPLGSPEVVPEWVVANTSVTGGASVEETRGFDLTALAERLLTQPSTVREPRPPAFLSVTHDQGASRLATPEAPA